MDKLIDDQLHADGQMDKGLVVYAYICIDGEIDIKWINEQNNKQNKTNAFKVLIFFF